MEYTGPVSKESRGCWWE